MANKILLRGDAARSPQLLPDPLFFSYFGGLIFCFVLFCFAFASPDASTPLHKHPPTPSEEHQLNVTFPAALTLGHPRRGGEAVGRGGEYKSCSAQTFPPGNLAGCVPRRLNTPHPLRLKWEGPPRPVKGLKPAGKRGRCAGGVTPGMEAMGSIPPKISAQPCGAPGLGQEAALGCPPPGPSPEIVAAPRSLSQQARWR